MASTEEAILASLNEAGLGEVLLLPSDPQYDQSIASYWSQSAQLRPWAIVQPRNTDEVSRFVKAIITVPGARFAIRSGGHMNSPGSNNIIDGVTLDLSRMNEAKFDHTTRLASVQPGARWKDVYSVVESHGVMVTGGRIGDVGVGGFLTGGGLSFFNCRTGLACASVACYQVVLANGSIVEANKDNNADLFRALKGGGNNFGIVTRFDLETFELKDLWGGFAAYSNQVGPALLDAYSDFMHHVQEKANGAFMLFWTYDSSKDDTSWMVVLMDLDGTPRDKMFEKVLAVPANFASLGTTKMSKITSEIVVPPGKYNSWRTLCFKYNDELMQKTHLLSLELIQAVRGLNIPGHFSLQFVAQPVLSSIATHSKTKGADTMGLGEVTHDSVMILIMAEFDNVELQQATEGLMKDMLDQIQGLAGSLNAHTDWLYLNYSHATQNPLTSYGRAAVDKLKEVSAKYDPTRVFQEMVPGGFKIPMT